MASILLDNVSVDFPIYDVNGRSLRRELVRIGTGGRIDQGPGGRVTVRALDHISLVVRAGDRLGIIGHNGAGKSTLLRTAAGIYEPVAGRVEVRGRVAPLFDIMLGIDQDLTGYENIFVRGFYLDMTRKRMQEKIGDIAAFSDLGNYLHMPLRTYSTGMLVRLAFSIATSIPADILLMDEVIGAGDAAFHRKAEARLNQFIADAKIFVVASHSTELLRHLCNRGVVLHSGRVAFDGSVGDAIRYYEDWSARAA